MGLQINLNPQIYSNINNYVFVNIYKPRKSTIINATSFTSVLNKLFYFLSFLLPLLCISFLFYFLLNAKKSLEGLMPL